MRSVRSTRLALNRGMVPGGSGTNGRDPGMTTLRDQAFRLVQEGKTTVAEVLRTVYVL